VDREGLEGQRWLLVREEVDLAAILEDHVRRSAGVTYVFRLYRLPEELAELDGQRLADSLPHG
jgi:hypothetical protein